MESMLKRVALKQQILKKRNQSVEESNNGEQLDADCADEDAHKKKPKDDWELKHVDDKYVDNTYWKLPEMYQIDDLMEEIFKEDTTQE